MRKKFLILSSFVFFINNLSAQHCVPFITLDPDGYTNIRKEPNSKSEIVGKVCQYQVFVFTVECDDDLSNYDTSNWIPVSTNKQSGYIYRKNLLQLNKLPTLKKRQTIKCNSNIRGKLINSNDTLTVTIYMEPFDRNKHELEITNDSDGEHVWSIDGNFFYGSSGNRMPVREIKMIEILCNERKTTLSNERMENLYDPHTMQVHIGQTGELYLNISGGGDEGRYSVWFSIVDGNIVYECFEDFCW
jgi:hypothetical protein